MIRTMLSHVPVPPVQARLNISVPGDRWEREADAMARHVVDGTSPRPPSLTPVPGGALLRQESSNPPDMEEALRKQRLLQTKRGTPGSRHAVPLAARVESASVGGSPLLAPVRTRMERAFQASFAHVRVHDDTEAAALNRELGAEAFTYRNHVHFAAGRYAPHTRSGSELLAHELTHTVQQGGGAMIQRRGGAGVGTLGVHSNVVSAGLTAGHAWLSYSPVAGARTTYGTWGNRTPIGLHRDLELAYVAAASRTTTLDAGDYANLTTFAAANNAWGYINNCSSFAARGWYSVTGESLAHRTVGIPNPSALGAGIVAANGGTVGVLPAAPAAAGGSSSF